MNRKIKETLGSRKFWATILISGSALGLFSSGYIDVDRMIEIVRWAAGIYVGGLSVEDAAKKIGPVLKTIFDDKAGWPNGKASGS